MENLFDDDSSSDEAQKPVKEDVGEGAVIPELKLEPAVLTGDDNVFDDDGVDLCSPWALLDVAESNPSILLPTVLPGPKDTPASEIDPLKFFSTPGTHFMHIQMPNAMPHIDKERTLQEDHGGVTMTSNSRTSSVSSEQDATDDDTDEPLIYQTTKMSCLPSGRLGKIRIHKSGKIKLHVGSHVFNFAPGNKVSCKQQVGCLLEENNEFLFLGNYRNKFVVSPDYNAMLRHL